MCKDEHSDRKITNVDLMTDEEKEAMREFEEMVGQIQTTQEMADECHDLRELLSKVPTNSEMQRRYNEYVTELENMEVN